MQNFSPSELALLKRCVMQRIVVFENLIKAAVSQNRPISKLEAQQLELWFVYHHIEEEENKEETHAD